MKSRSITESSSEMLCVLDDDEAWDAYTLAIEEMSTSTRVLKKDKLENLAEAKTALLSRNLFPVNDAISQLSTTATRDDWKEQAENYKEHYHLTEKQFQFIMRVLVYLGDYCAKRRITAPIHVAWEKLKESGTVPAENAFSTYMYILGTDCNDNACRDSLMEVAKMHDLFYKPNEKTVTLQIKTLIAKNEVEEAEKILSSLENGKGDDAQRLRTFLPILDHYCSTGDCKSIFRIFRSMRESAGVHFDVDTYTLILCTLADQGCFLANASVVEGAAKIGFNATSGPMLFDQLMTELAEDILELNEESCAKLSASFSKSMSSESTSDDDVGVPLLPNVTQQLSSPLIVGRTKIDIDSGRCPATGAKLRLINLVEEQRQHVHDTLIKMAEIQYVEFTKDRKKPVEENKGFVELTRFSEWLDNREGEPFTVVVDGPNIGFFGFGQFHYSQVKAIVEELERMGEKPLVTMPQKYIGSSFHLRKNGQNQKLTAKDLAYIEKLQQDEKMYVVPQLCLDDYYWMLASVSNQTVSRQGQDLRVPASTEDERFPGVRPVLVTNDQMRDHKLELLEPREFRRWRSCHIVNYNILKTNSDEWAEREVRLFPADFFSREIQCNSWTVDSDRQAWHFPVTEWDGPDRFLISIAR